MLLICLTEGGSTISISIPAKTRDCSEITYCTICSSPVTIPGIPNPGKCSSHSRDEANAIPANCVWYRLMQMAAFLPKCRCKVVSRNIMCDPQFLAPHFFKALVLDNSLCHRKSRTNFFRRIIGKIIIGRGCPHEFPTFNFFFPAAITWPAVG